MPKIFLDSNIWLRFLLRDHPIQSQECVELLKKTERAKFKPYISNIVLLEINYVFSSYYKQSKSKIQKILSSVLKTRNLQIIEETNSLKALSLYKKTNIKYADCLITTQIPENTTFITYDFDFKKINFLKTQTPAEILNKINSQVLK